MTNKERLLKAIADLEAQGDYGFANGRCSYHTTEGKRCVVGLMMLDPKPSDHAMPTVASLINVMEHGTKEAMDLPDYRNLLAKLGNVTRDEMELLAMLQFIHDEAALDNLPLSECVSKLREEVEVFYAK